MLLFFLSAKGDGIMNKLACVVIWYNPSLLEVQNIRTYSSCFEKVYIVDNSNSDNKTLAEEIADSVYISNGKNLGIAAALNKGCQKACSDGFEWCLTMDQDSTWSSDLLEMYLKEVALNHSELTVSFAPAMNLSEKSFSIIGDIRRFFTGKETLPEKQFVENVMTSGNIISLKIWEKTGKFDEKLFIDEVDSDFCFRLISSGYRILKFNNIFFNHTLGTPKKSFFPMTYSYHEKRCYYISRNKRYLISKYPELAHKYNHSLMLNLFVLGKILTAQFSDMKYIMQGKKDFKHNIFGEYNATHE